MELAVVKYIKKNGLEKTVKDFKLIYRDYGHKILLKYDQIDSDMSQIEVQESRGLILEKNTWKVMSLAFTKFFNSAETNAAKIDWDTAHVFEKCDGSLCNVYWDWVLNEWCVATTGMANAEGDVNNKPNTSFSKLFWDTLNGYETFDMNALTKGFTYSFELMTPYNIVVCPHEYSHVALLAIRDLESLNEIDYLDFKEEVEVNIGLPVVKRYNFNASNIGHLINKFDEMSAFEEGYVVCDANFNRVKIKNPAYVALHHLKGKMGNHHIISIIKTNEIDEFIVSFPERREEILNLQKSYTELISLLNETWIELKDSKPKNITKQEQKKFAMKVFEVIKKNKVENFSGLFFSLKDGKFNTVNEFMVDYDDKKLYEMFVK